ncbi:MAG: protein-glutamate O-methyltransferase CheR [Candidatus Heimdallarchaeota archaeon]|nr:protein-glutamate O-methyltransferase CheR [Candidatus Heimdallarchaeota archaeon]
MSEDKKKVARGATLFSKRKVDHEKARKRDLTRNKKLLDDPDKFPTITQKYLDTRYLDSVINYLGKSGIEVGQYKTSYLNRRIKVRLGRLRLESYKDYLDYLKKHPFEIKEVQETLSINVTRFFRNRDTFDALKEDILPELARQALKDNRNQLKIWSAGCAVGAEPYSLSMIVSDSILSQIEVKIIATDVKNELLAIARNGIYSEGYLAEMTDVEILKHFIKTSEDDYEVSLNLKRMINFSQQDLMKDKYPSGLDMITCRNVLIYVDREAQFQIISKFFQSLRPGGILVLGRTETLFGNWREVMDIVSTRHRVYRKKKTSSAVKFLDKREDTKPKKAKKSPKRKRVIIATSVAHKERMQELKNFRQTFEERRKIWTLREEAIGRRARNQLKLLKSLSVKDIKQPTQHISRPIRKFKTKTSGPLSNYRTMLKKRPEPLGKSSLRPSSRENKKDGLPTGNPEEIYQMLVRKRKERERARRERNG